MDDREKEVEKKIREFDRQQLSTELRFKKLKELDEAEKTCDKLKDFRTNHDKGTGK